MKTYGLEVQVYHVGLRQGSALEEFVLWSESDVRVL